VLVYSYLTPTTVIVADSLSSVRLLQRKRNYERRMETASIV
jgi:hypothetical protein